MLAVTDVHCPAILSPIDVLVRKTPALTAPLFQAMVDAEWAFCSLLSPNSRAMEPLDKGRWHDCQQACHMVLVDSSRTPEMFPLLDPKLSKQQVAPCHGNIKMKLNNRR